VLLADGLSLDPSLSDISPGAGASPAFTVYAHEGDTRRDALMATITQAPTARKPIWARRSCRHGWMKHFTAKKDDFVHCMPCGLQVRIEEVSDVERSNDDVG
jgi:hypothetical protein